MQIIESGSGGLLAPLPLFICSAVLFLIAVCSFIAMFLPIRNDFVEQCIDLLGVTVFFAIILAIMGIGGLVASSRAQSVNSAIETYQKKGTLAGSATVLNVDNHNLSVVQENVTHDAPKISDSLRNSIIDDPKFRQTADILNDYVPLNMREQIKPNDKLTFEVVDSKLISLSIDRPVENNSNVQHIVLK